MPDNPNDVSQSLDEDDGIKFDFVQDFARTWLVSTLLHIALILILAILTITAAAEKTISLAISPNPVDEMEFTTYELEFEPVELETEELLDRSQSENSLEEMAPLIQVEHDVGNTFALDNSMDDFGFDGSGLEELAIEPANMATVQFFGSETKGQKFVFVVDNSNSMTRGKFETALAELEKTVRSLTKKQKFYVVFFSDTAYPMFHPKPAKKLIPATEDNKDQLVDWLYNVEMCLKTKGAEAMAIAIKLNPDVIYVLGDGAFTDNTEKLMTARHNRKIVVNTLGMQVNQKGVRQLKAIAKANKGTYKNVEVEPQAAKSAKRNPVKRNKTRGKVWGITLPRMDKKK